MGLRRKMRAVVRAPNLFGRLLGSKPRSVGASKGRHILLAPPGGGNIGDQALVDAFVSGVRRPVTVVVRRTSAFAGLAESTDVKLLELPHLLHGALPFSLRDARRLRKHMVGAASFSVIGADVMDGAYDWPASSTRWALARRAALDGLDTRIIGFSWNAAPHPRTASALRRAASAGVRVLARDPASEERLARIVPAVELTADIVFTDERQAPLPTDLAWHLEDAAPYAVVNASGLVARTVEQTSGYLRAVQFLIASGHHVILLPHVIRATGDDLAACRTIWESLSGEERDHVLFVDDLLQPAQVRQLAAGARLVVAGRMHLGVITLSQGVPAIVVATQGKVEGLMASFGSAELLVEPASIPDDSIRAAIGVVLADEKMFRARIARRLPRVMELASRNLAGLR